MRRRIGIFGASEETLTLIPLLSANPGIEIVRVFDDDVDGVMSRLAHMEPGVAALLEQTLTSDAEAFAGDTSLAAVVDTAREGGFAERFPAAAERGVQVVTPLAARMLWGYGAGSTAPPPARPPEPGPPAATTADSAPPPAAPVAGHKEELLQALSEIVESYNLTIDTDELFTRMLEIAISVIGADGGSLMLLDEPSGELRVRVAVGVEPELWPKIRVPLGEGIAGRVASEGRPLRLRGRADRQHFRIVRERLDVESALSVPLIHGGRVLGVLNLHHGSRPDAFSEDDLAFSEQLAHLDAQIIARAQEHEVLRAQAARYSAVREVREIMTSRTGLDERLSQLCAFVAERSGRGIASVYHYEPDEDALRLAATSLDAAAGGGGFRIALGQGIDGQVAQSRVPTFLRGSEGAVAYAALPLVAGDSLAGVLSIQAGSDAPQGRAAEEMLLEIAAAAAEELVHADRETRIAARANKVAAINEAGIRMISTSDLAEVLRLGTSEATLVLESDHAVVRLQDEETRRYVIRSYFGSAEGQLQEQLFRLDKEVSVDVLKRRVPLIVRDVAADERLRASGFEVRSLMAAPLSRDGQVIGTIAVYDRIAPDRIYPGCFSDQDLKLFTRFATCLERAIGNALFLTRARQYRNFDEETGLPNASYLHKRIQEEIVRAGPREGALALAVARIDNLTEIEQRGDPVKTRRIVTRVVEALQSRTRDFDVIGRTEENEFAVLLPEPGHAPSELVFEMARAVADDVSRDDQLNDPVRISLAFGYASYPKDGADREVLLTKAREARIRMV